MLNDTDIEFICIANKKIFRKWVVSSIKYDFDSDNSYCYKALKDNEYCEFGSPFDAYNHAKHLSRKYKKLYFDAIVIIREEAIN